MTNQEYRSLSMRRLVIVNQEANYLTTGLANAFSAKFDSVTLLVGVLYPQGETLQPDIDVVRITRMIERPRWRKAWSYLSGLLQIWWLLITRFRKHEVLFVSVPPMGYLLNLILPHRFSMVIWDLYPDILRVTGVADKNPVFCLWGWLNRQSFRKAYRVFTIGDVLADAMSQYIDREKLRVHPIWSMYREVPKIAREDNEFIKLQGLTDKFVVQYSGNIGLTHNVEILLDVAERLQDQERIVFQIIGRGPRIPNIERLVTERALRNIQLLPFQTAEMFPHSISAADLGVVILNEKVSRGSVPSKAYNLMSFGIPALYIAAPDSQLAIDARRFGHARCFSANQVDSVAEFIRYSAEHPDQLRQLSSAALRAAQHFRPDNSQTFVESYFSVS